MKLSQLKPWLKASPNKIPHCVLSCYAGCSDYLMEVEYKHQLRPLKDEKDNLLHFQNIEQAQTLLKSVGISNMTLRLTDPYDEFSADGKVSQCEEDIVLHF
ncbi:DUF6482 family protein [Photobacterium leiognathi]|uniref:DUF6482 family protein n=1 Tax=Photobacterium leiognathi TaxID=553611 RepID=UPI000208895A|nr:DUF6482 family protein [Photobacterium leiognathi]PSW52319.1 hypothetical protein CTM83_14735 [Photobacterium leiognathi subsp. mandapamensis]GAA05556.1 lysyl-tRNA synthetase [Photobacterium leiognathi subsp. mandapamensis svers.1.1.]